MRSISAFSTEKWIKKKRGTQATTCLVAPITVMQFSFTTVKMNWEALFFETQPSTIVKKYWYIPDYHLNQSLH